MLKFTFLESELAEKEEQQDMLVLTNQLAKTDSELQ